MENLTLTIYPDLFSVIQIESLDKIKQQEPIFIGSTQDELSVVTKTSNVPQRTINREDHWRLFKIDAVLDFSLIGILAKISSLLAENSISIFVVSTYNTDYFLVQETDLENAKTIFQQNGYQIKE